MRFRHRLRTGIFVLAGAALPIVAACLSISMLFAPTATDAIQTIPYAINFQGRLTDNNGNVLADGSYNIKFRIFNAATGGTNEWEADRVYGTSDDRVSVQNGLFNIQFGDTSQGDPALSPSLFSGAYPLYLEVELPTPATATCATNGCAVWTEGAMTPRQALASSPYAFNSDTLDGLDSTAFGQITANNTFTGANLFAPTASSTVALTVKASTAGGSDSLDVYDSGGVRQAFFDATGALTLSKAITAPTSSNTINSLVINAGALSNVTGLAMASGNFLQSGSGTFGTGSGAVSLNGTTTVAAGDNLILPAGTGTFQQSFSSTTSAASGQTLAFTNNNTTTAGVTMQGINITPQVNAPTSSTNVLNIMNFAAGNALTGAENANGLNFASATGYTNFIKTPTFVLSSAGAITGAASIAVATITNVGSLTATTTTATAVNANTVTTGTALTDTGLTTSAAGVGALILGGANTTTGVGLLFNTTSNTLSTGSALSVTGAAAATTAGYTGALINVNPTRTHTAATSITDSGNFLNLTRSNTVNNAGGTIVITGALANLQSTCTVTAGICTDSANIANLNQQYANASGAVLNVQGAGTGNQAVFDASNASANGVSVDVQSSGTSQYVLKLTSNNAATNVLYARADGHVGIGTTTPADPLDVNGDINGTGFSSGGTAGQSSTVSCSANQAVTAAVFTTGLLTTAPTCSAITGTGANTALSNLTTTSINQSLIANADNSFDLGSAGAIWKDVFTGNVDAGTTTTALTIGTSNATSIQIGKSGVAPSLPGGLTTSGGAINTGSGNITSTGTVGANAIQTNSTTRIDSSGNLSNIGTISSNASLATGTAVNHAVTASGTSGTNTVTGINVALTGTANSTGSNAVTGLNFTTPTGATNNTFTAQNYATGYGNLLTYNGTTVIINGTGQLNGAQLSTGTVANGALASSSLTVSPGTGLTGGGLVSLGGTTTLNIDQTASLSWTGAEQFNKSGGVGAQFNGTAASAGAQLLFGSVTGLNGGSTSGTYIGANPASYAGDFINLAIGSVNKFKVDNSGNVTAAGTVTGSTFSGSGASLTNLNPTNLVQGSGAVTLQSAAATAVTITSNAAATWSTSGSTQLTVQSGSGQLSLGTTSSVAAGGALTVESTGANALTLATQTSGANVALNPNGTGIVTVGGTTPTLSGNTSLTLQSASASNINITPGTTGSVVVGGTTPTITTSGATALKVDTGGSAALSLGTANASSVNIGNTTAGTQVLLQGGTDAGGTGGANAIGLTAAANGEILTTTTGTGITEFDSGAGVVVQSTTNNTTAFQIQNSGGVSMLNIDTSTGAAQNLLSDSGFEKNPTTNWSNLPAGGSFTRVTTQAFSDFASAEETTGTTAGDGIYQAITLGTSTQYTLSFYAKADTSTPSITDLRAGYSSTGVNTGEVNCTLTSTTVITTGWNRYVCTFTTPGTESGTPYIYIGHTTTTNDVFYIDAAQLETGSFASPYGQGQLTLNATINSPVNFQETANSLNAFQITNTIGTNILNVDTFDNNQNNQATNPSFETGLTGWTAKTGCTLTQDNTTAYNGSSSALCTNTATANAGMNMTGISPVMVSGTTYTLSLYVKASANMTTLEIGHADNGTTDTSCLTAQTVTSLGWKRLTCTFTAGAQSGTPYVYVKQTDATARSIWVDAVTLETDANASTNYRDGRISLGNATISSPAVFQTNTNSTTAFQVQNAAGIQVFDIDTASDTNLVSNSGFEVNSVGWSVKGSATGLIRDTSKSYVGIASGKVTTSATAGDGMRYTFGAALPAVAATAYTISGYVESSTADASFTMGYNNGTDTTCTDTPASSATVPSASGWTRFVCSTPVNTTVNSIFFENSTAIATTLNVDGVQVVLGSTAPAFGNSNISFNGVFTSPIAIRNPNNTTTEFQVQDASSNTLLGVDSLNDMINVGATGTTAIASTANIATSTGATQTINIGSASAGTAAAGTIVSIQGGSSSTNGAVVIGTNGAGGITIDSGTTGNVNLGTGANAKAIAIGNTTTTTTVTIEGGATAGTAIAIGNGATAHVIKMGTGAAVQAIAIGSTTTTSSTTIEGGATAGTSIGIGTAATAHTIQVGTSTGATQTITIGSSTNGGAAAATAVDVQGGTTANTAVLIGTNGAGGITIDSGTTGNVNIGNNANAKTITIGNTTGATAVDLVTGTGGVVVMGTTPTITTSGATALKIDTGGAAALNLGPTNATSVVVGGNTAATITDKVANTSTTAYTLQTAGGTSLLVADSTDSRLYVGGSAGSGTPILLVFGDKNTTGDPTGVAGSEYYNSTNNVFRCAQGGTTFVDCIQPFNGNSTAQTVNATTAYLAGSNIAIPGAGLKAGTQFTWRLGFTKLAVGATAPTIQVKYGTNGSTADATENTFALPTETAATDTGQITIVMTVATVNSTTGSFTANLSMTRANVTATGLIATANQQAFVGSSTPANFNDTTAGAIVGLALAANTDEWTFQTVQVNVSDL
jgi:mucin-6/19